MQQTIMSQLTNVLVILPNESFRQKSHDHSYEIKKDMSILLSKKYEQCLYATLRKTDECLKQHGQQRQWKIVKHHKMLKDLKKVKHFNCNEVSLPDFPTPSFPTRTSFTKMGLFSPKRLVCAVFMFAYDRDGSRLALLAGVN